jgi:hypothetical protein
LFEHQKLVIIFVAESADKLLCWGGETVDFAEGYLPPSPKNNKIRHVISYNKWIDNFIEREKLAYEAKSNSWPNQ